LSDEAQPDGRAVRPGYVWASSVGQLHQRVPYIAQCIVSGLQWRAAADIGRYGPDVSASLPSTAADEYPARARYSSDGGACVRLSAALIRWSRRRGDEGGRGGG